jgi:hypothetical protein
LLKTPLVELDNLSVRSINNMIRKMARKNNELENILYDDSPDKKRWFLMNVTKYYWIRVEELP